jgi:hypothetical protein
MGILMIRCSKIGRAISTGAYVEPTAFRSSPYFSAKPTVHIAMRRMSGSLKMHGYYSETSDELL